jgi:hypothetical protein
VLREPIQVCARECTITEVLKDVESLFDCYRAARLEADMAQAARQAQSQQPGINKLRDKVNKAEQQLQV